MGASSSLYCWRKRKRSRKPIHPVKRVQVGKRGVARNSKHGRRAFFLSPGSLSHQYGLRIQKRSLSPILRLKSEGISFPVEGKEENKRLIKKNTYIIPNTTVFSNITKSSTGSTLSPFCHQICQKKFLRFLGSRYEMLFLWILEFELQSGKLIRN